MKSNKLISIFFLLFALFSCKQQKDIIIENFEANGLENWIYEGNFLQNFPQTVSTQIFLDWGNRGFEGKFMLSTFENGDGGTGTLTSPEFTIAGKYLNFLIGGGNDIDNLYVALLVDGAEVRRATGRNSRTMSWVSWEIDEFQGKSAQLKIVDNSTAGWGFIDADNFYMSDNQPNVAKISFKVAKNDNYILLPMEELGGELETAVFVDGIKTNTFFMRLAQTKIDYWMPFEVSAYQGKTISFEVAANIPKNALFITKAKTSDKFDFDYNEKFRPLFHFTPPYGWMNDPNGMVYYDGEYHLCYQWNPFGNRWQNMSWGHAISKDLLYWKHMPVALLPDSLGTIFSGGSVVDHNNTAGFQTGGNKTLLAFFTHAERIGQVQSLAYSTDRGRTWIKYNNNPILKHETAVDFRDPKVFWHEPTEKWIMILAVGQVMEFYSSPDAINWTFESEFGEGYGAHGGVWECPDLFELAVEGNPNLKKWVLICNINPGGPSGGSAAQYFIGSFDGKKFSSDDKETRWLDWGKDHYALVSWSDIPKENGRRIGIAWMSNWEYANYVPTLYFRSAMSVPRELILAQINGNFILKNTPVKEIENLRKEISEFSDIRIADNHIINNLPPSGAYELLMDIEKQSAQKFGFKLKNAKNEEVIVTFDFAQNTFSFDRTKSGIVGFSRHFPAVTAAPLMAKQTYQLRLLVDVCSVEAFIDGGEVSMTNLIFPNEPYNKIEFFTENGNTRVNSLKIIALK